VSKKKASRKTNKTSKKSGKKKYKLQLFVISFSPNSIRAIVNLKKICEKYLQGDYELEIIDISLQPHIATKEQIVVVPFLIKKTPLPEFSMIGDLSDTPKVLEGLGILL
jgi:circadian clock protein KaiB